MRVVASSLILVLAGVIAVSASPQPAKDDLMSALKGWEKAMTDLKSFVAVVDRTSLDKQLNVKDDYKGYAMFVKGTGKDEQSRARLELAKTAKVEVFEKYIYSGTFLYEYVPATKTIRIHEMGKNKQIMQESLLSFLFGTSAEDALKRYDMKYVIPEDPKTKKPAPDPHYHYILIRPKTAKDQGDFIEARLSLLRSNHLPAQVWYLQPNKNEITWNFTKMQIDVQIPLTYFQSEDIKGWKSERVPAQQLPPMNKK
jgi:TIGR03009 family protein